MNYGADPGSGTQTIFSGVGLTLRATCVGSNDISINATTSKQNASIYTSLVNTVQGQIYSDELEGGAFDVGTNFDRLADGQANPSLITFEYNATDGSLASGIIAVNEVPGCQATGHVTNAKRAVDTRLAD